MAENLKKAYKSALQKVKNFVKRGQDQKSQPDGVRLNTQPLDGNHPRENHISICDYREGNEHINNEALASILEGSRIWIQTHESMAFSKRHSSKMSIPSTYRGSPSDSFATNSTSERFNSNGLSLLDLMKGTSTTLLQNTATKKSSSNLRKGSSVLQQHNSELDDESILHMNPHNFPESKSRFIPYEAMGELTFHTMINEKEEPALAYQFLDGLASEAQMASANHVSISDNGSYSTVSNTQFSATGNRELDTILRYHSSELDPYMTCEESGLLKGSYFVPFPTLLHSSSSPGLEAYGPLSKTPGLRVPPSHGASPLFRSISVDHMNRPGTEIPAPLSADYSEDGQMSDTSLQSLQYQSKIGAGSYGRVYKGSWNNQAVAIKVVPHVELSRFSSNTHTSPCPSPMHRRTDLCQSLGSGPIDSSRPSAPSSNGTQYTPRAASPECCMTQQWRSNLFRTSSTTVQSNQSDCSTPSGKSLEAALLHLGSVSPGFQSPRTTYPSLNSCYSDRFTPAAQSGGSTRSPSVEVEAALATSLCHPNIVQTYTAFTISRSSSIANGNLSCATSSPSSCCLMSGFGSSVTTETHIVMELCTAGCLRDVLTRGTLKDPRTGSEGRHSIGSIPTPDIREALHLGADIASAVAYLHENGVVHADLKASNVMLVPAFISSDRPSSGSRASPSSCPADLNQGVHPKAPSSLSPLSNLATITSKSGSRAAPSSFPADLEQGVLPKAPPANFPGLYSSLVKSTSLPNQSNLEPPSQSTVPTQSKAGTPSKSAAQVSLGSTAANEYGGCAATSYKRRYIAKLIDFGSSHCSALGQKLPGNMDLTTPTHVAPELLITRGAGSESPDDGPSLPNKSASPECDIYSLGVLLWELFTGGVPYAQRKTLLDVIHAKCYRNTKDELPFPGSTPSAVVALIQSCWLDADQRPSAKEVEMQLATLCQAL